MYFQPVLPNGTLVRLPWQLRFGPFSVLWPLQDRAVRRMKIADMIFTTFALCSFVFVLEAAAHNIVKNFSDIMAVTDGLATFAVYSDCILRMCDMALKKNELRDVLKRFYQEIYIYEDENHTIIRQIKRTIIIPIRFYSYFYNFTGVAFCLGPIVSAILYNTRTMPNRLEFHYDLGNPLVYALTIASPIFNIAIGLLMFTGDLSLLANFVGHLCARYDLLESDLKNGGDLLCNADPFKMTQKFRIILFKAAYRTRMLNGFARLLSVMFSFRIFSMIAHGGIMLCAVTFQTTKAEFGTTKFTAFVGWMASKLFELIIFGYLGSKLTTSTNSASSTFYNCNWEGINYRSTNANQNIKLMRDVQLAISIFHKPLEIDALGFFHLSLPTAAWLIRLAGSYFAFLTTFQ